MAKKILDWEELYDRLNNLDNIEFVEGEGDGCIRADFQTGVSIWFYRNPRHYSGNTIKSGSGEISQLIKDFGFKKA